MSHVLIIDDEPDGCEAVAGYLARSGHSVRCATDGQAALVALEDFVPDAILLDVRMPGMDGIAMLQVLRSYLRGRLCRSPSSPPTPRTRGYGTSTCTASAASSQSPRCCSSSCWSG